MSQTTIETHRLKIRSFVLEDLPGIHRILDQTFGVGDKVDDEIALQERRSWLQVVSILENSSHSESNIPIIRSPSEQSST